jgi:hypothetical protein
MNVRIASENEKEKWNMFVDREDGSFFQYFDWKYVYEFNTLKHRFIPLIIENDSSEILGIFPLEENLQSLYGSLESLPLGASDGFLIKKDLIESEKNIVIQLFIDYIDAHYSGTHSQISLREHLPSAEQSLCPSQILIQNGYSWFNNSSTRLPCTYVLPLEKPFKEKIFKSMVKNLRNRIRHTRKTGVEVIIDDDFAYIDDFCTMQIESVKKFGHVQRKETYEQIFKIFPEKINLFVCLVDSEPITALLTYYTPTTAYGAVGPTSRKAKSYLNNTLPMCASIRNACDTGYKYFDMGITQTSSLASYKEKFGAKRIPLMIYQKKFSPVKITANKTFSGIAVFVRKCVKNTNSRNHFGTYP